MPGSTGPGTPARRLASIVLLLGGAYGIAMGLYATLRPAHASFAQLAATVVKVPLLFLLTLAVTYPSLYVVSALLDSRLRHAETLRLLLVSMCANLALLASLGPVTAFFTLSTESYEFMKLLNVLFFAVSGAAGVAFLNRALQAVHRTTEDAPAPAAASGEDPEPRRAAVRPRGTERAASAQGILRIWVVIYGTVGAQMGWILRPFIGSPEQEFTLFRPRESNFFQAVFRALGRLLS